MLRTRRRKAALPISSAASAVAIFAPRHRGRRPPVRPALPGRTHLLRRVKKMTEHSKTNPRARRMRNALLASAFTIGLAGAAGFGGTLIEGRVALADPVQVEAAAPADFTAVVESVRPAVVTVQVRTETEASNRNFPEEFQNLPPDHPLFDFFEQFRERGGNGDDGDRGRGMRPFNPDRGLSQGSGFFISEDGYLVTNYHVVEDATEYTVIMDDG